LRRTRRRAVARDRAVALAAIAVAVGAAVWLSRGDGATLPPQPQAVSAARAPGAAPPVRSRAALAAALRGGVNRAAAGGSLEAAVELSGWDEPAIAGSPPGASSRWMRMWSMSKIVTMVALLRELGWGKRAGRPLPAEVESAFWGAVSRSENCRQRRVILELQLASGGKPEDARRAVAEVLAAAGSEARLSDEVAPPDPSCRAFLEGEAQIADPLAPALLLGTSTWRVGDAVRFTHALATGVYGDAVGDLIIAAMRAPKAASREIPPGELTAPLDWGAGQAFAGLVPAYKAGWGGSQDDEFLAGQIAVVDLSGGGRLALAVMFHPDVQPPTDDPGSTAAPDAVGTVMAWLRRGVE
jgi:hypothetical protein